ncbi:protein of unknown function [Tenacibaculum sp. 190524A02b]|uniref:Uncharacterized protein n=1 Tax=Tenacibaculum vairaonense TaxID=3137860 RepID=A0ABP1F5W9_9FLAO
MTKFFSNKTLILGLVGTLTLGAINLTSEEVVSGEAKETTLTDTDVVNAQEAGVPAVAVAARVAYMAYRYYRRGGRPGAPGPRGANAASLDQNIAKLDK